MAGMLTSLENETELSAIERNNILSERKCAKFERQRDEVFRSLRNLEECNSQVKCMAIITEEKLTVLKSEVEKHRSETKKATDHLNSLLNSSFEQVDFIRANNRVSLHCGNPTLAITLPYDSCIETSVQAESKLRSALGEVSIFNDRFKTERENLAKGQSFTSKAKGKAEKDIIKLNEEIQRQTGIVTALESSASEMKSRLNCTKVEVETMVEKKTKLESEVKTAKKTLDNLLQTVSPDASSKSARLTVLDKLHTSLSNDSPVDITLISELADDQDISQLFDEWKVHHAENADFSQTVDISDSETPDTLEATLENVKKQKKHVLKNIEQMKECSEKYVLTNEKLSRKKSGVEAVRKQIAENTKVLNSLRVTENAVRLSDPENKSSKKEEILRQLAATRNEVPGPEPYQPYQTPDHVAPLVTNGKVKANTMKRVSVGSGSTRNMSNTGPQYPGIKLVSQKSDSEAPVSLKVTPEELDVSANFDDSSLISEDSASTQDDSMINQLFSPLSNDIHDPPPVVEFSMAAHMNDFSQRQAKMKASQKVKNSANDLSKDVDLDVDDEDDENDKRLFASALHGPGLDISAVESEGEDENEDDDEDLFARDDVDMNQSAWGSDD